MPTIYELLNQIEIMKRMIAEYINKLKVSEKIAKYPEGWKELIINVAMTMSSEDAFLFGTCVGMNFKKFFQNIYNKLGLKESIGLIKDIENKDMELARQLTILLGIFTKSNIDKYDITILLAEIKNLPNDICK